MGTMIQCQRCRAGFDLELAMNGSAGYWPEIDVVKCLLPCCQQVEQFQLSPGKLSFGYLTVTDRPRWSAVRVVEVPGLEVSVLGRVLRLAFDGRGVEIAPDPD